MFNRQCKLQWDDITSQETFDPASELSRKVPEPIMEVCIVVGNEIRVPTYSFSTNDESLFRVPWRPNQCTARGDVKTMSMLKLGSHPPRLNRLDRGGVDFNGVDDSREEQRRHSKSFSRVAWGSPRRVPTKQKNSDVLLVIIKPGLSSPAETVWAVDHHVAPNSPDALPLASLFGDWQARCYPPRTFWLSDGGGYLGRCRFWDHDARLHIFCEIGHYCYE